MGMHAGDMLGLGSLTLPSVFARLGWIPALLVVLFCGLGTLYSGRLFALLATKASSSRPAWHGACLKGPSSPATCTGHAKARRGPGQSIRAIA